MTKTYYPTKETVTVEVPAAEETTTSETAATDETADWKIYINNEYGFSFKYPSDWLVKDMTSANKTLIEGMVGFFGRNPISSGESVFFTVQINSQSLSNLIKNEKTIISKNPNEELVSELNVNKYGINGTELKIKNKSTGVVFSKNYIVNNSRTYIITGDSTDTDTKTKIANQINGTFEFTK